MDDSTQYDESPDNKECDGQPACNLKTTQTLWINSNYIEHKNLYNQYVKIIFRKPCISVKLSRMGLKSNKYTAGHY